MPRLLGVAMEVGRPGEQNREAECRKRQQDPLRSFDQSSLHKETSGPTLACPPLRRRRASWRDVFFVEPSLELIKAPVKGASIAS